MLANPNPTKWEEINANDTKLRVLDFLANTQWNVHRAAVSAGIRRIAVYEWLKEDREFASRFDEIKQGWLDKMEGNLIKQGAENEKAWVPAIFMLKSHRPETYGDKYEINANVTNAPQLTETASRDIEAFLKGKAVSADFQVLPESKSPAIAEQASQ